MCNTIMNTLLTMFLAVLTTASITNTITTGKIFLPLRNWVVRQRARPNVAELVKGTLFIPLCQYCCSHWVGIAVSFMFGLNWMTIFPVIWLAQHTMLFSVTQGKKLEILHSHNEAFQTYARIGGSPPPVRPV